MSQGWEETELNLSAGALTSCLVKMKMKSLTIMLLQIKMPTSGEQ